MKFICEKTETSWKKKKTLIPHYFFLFTKSVQKPYLKVINLFLHIYSFYHIEEKSFRKTLWKKVKLLRMSNFAFFHNVFYAICMLKSIHSHIPVVVCSFFEFGTVSKWSIREYVKGRDYMKCSVSSGQNRHYPKNRVVLSTLMVGLKSKTHRKC